MSPSRTHGKVCYLEVPASDPRRSSEFYNRIFGWKMRTRGDGTLAFDDSTGQVSGAFVTGRTPYGTSPGLLVYIMVDSVADAVKSVEENGGTIVQPIGGDAPEITARFSDQAGNVIGLYQEPA